MLSATLDYLEMNLQEQQQCSEQNHLHFEHHIDKSSTVTHARLSLSIGGIQASAGFTDMALA